jgi:hypothetical protein
VVATTETTTERMRNRLCTTEAWLETSGDPKRYRTFPLDFVTGGERFDSGGSRLGLFLEQLLERGVVECGDAEIEQDVEKLVARDQITRREPLERRIDEIDETILRHPDLQSLEITVAADTYPAVRRTVTCS